MEKIVLLLAIFIPGAIFFACAARGIPTEKPVSPQPLSQEQKAAPKEAWQVEWEKALAEARKEGKVIIHIGAGIAPSVRQELSREMKSKYGLELEMIAGRATELAEKIIREHKAGLYMADLYIAGATTLLSRIKPAGVLDPLKPLLILPEVTDPQFWFQGKLPLVDKEEKYLIAFSAYPSSGLAFNASHVSKEDLQSYRDLLNPRWKGKIVMSDPSIGGSGNLWFSFIGINVMGMEYLKELAKQDLVFTRDLRQMVEWMAHGKYPIGIGAGGAMVEYQKAGIPLVEHTPKEGAHLTAGWGNMALYKNAPNPNATRVFVNWFLSREGQIIYSKGQDTQSARMDVPADFLTPAGVRQPGVNYFDARSEERALQSAQTMQTAREIFNIK